MNERRVQNEQTVEDREDAETVERGEGGTTGNHPAGVEEAVSEPRTAPVGARDEEEADDMPGGGAGYAGRGDTGSGPEAPGGAQGYASDDLPDDWDEVLEEEG
jgi:hypothetical protein